MFINTAFPAGSPSPTTLHFELPFQPPYRPQSHTLLQLLCHLFALHLSHIPSASYQARGYYWATLSSIYYA